MTYSQTDDKSTQFPSPPPSSSQETPIMVDVSLSKLKEEKESKEREERGGVFPTDWFFTKSQAHPIPLEDEDDKDDDDPIFIPEENPWYPKQASWDFMWGSHTAQWNPDLNCAICGRLVTSMSPGLRTWASQYDPWGKRYTTGTLCSPTCRAKYLVAEVKDLEAYSMKILTFMGNYPDNK